MDDWAWGLVAVAVVALVTYLTRIAGWFAGAWITEGSPVDNLMHALPGCALAAVLATTAALESVLDITALIVTAALFLWTRRALTALLAGVTISVLGAHLAG